MKAKFILSTVCACLLLCGCKKEEREKDIQEDVGTIEFNTTSSFNMNGVKNTQTLKTGLVNPALTGDTTKTYNTSMKVCIGDVWVSKQEVKAGNPDTIEWVRLTDVTNQDLKLIEDFTFAPKDIPVGTYKSIKLTLKNIFYRYVVLASDTSIKYELLETMGSSFDPCNVNDTSWAKTNYFSADGNHALNGQGVFEVVSAGEKIAGFTIEAGKTAVVTWRWGAGVTEPCINYLIDKNGNKVFDCGTDEIEYECPVIMEYMADFLVSYK